MVESGDFVRFNHTDSNSGQSQDYNGRVFDVNDSSVSLFCPEIGKELIIVQESNYDIINSMSEKLLFNRRFSLFSFELDKIKQRHFGLISDEDVSYYDFDGRLTVRIVNQELPNNIKTEVIEARDRVLRDS